MISEDSKTVVVNVPTQVFICTFVYFFFFCFFFFTPAVAALVCVAAASAAAVTAGNLSAVPILVFVGAAATPLLCCGVGVDEGKGAVRFCIFCTRECVKASNRLRMIDDRVLYFKH